MSRFSASRRAAIVVWTGASLAWASTVAGVLLEPERGDAGDTNKTVTAQSDTARASFPTAPHSGLLVIRHDGPTDAPTRATAVAEPVTASEGPPTPPAPPQPVSSGS